MMMNNNMIQKNNKNIATSKTPLLDFAQTVNIIFRIIFLKY
jgi:hypothetical protein